MYNSNIGTFPGKKLKGVERYKKLYHYTSFDSFVKIWLSKSLKFSPVSNVNDIQEKVIEASIINPEQFALAKNYIAIRKSFKQVSFTMDYDSYLKGCMSPMMWGLYADKTKGVCIELDYDKIHFSANTLKDIVLYKPILKRYHGLDPQIKTEKDLRKFVLKQKKELFFTKHKCWAGENEFRVLNNKEEYLSIEGAINSIYIASYENRDLILNLVNRVVPLFLFTHDFALDNSAIPVLKEIKQE